MFYVFQKETIYKGSSLAKLGRLVRKALDKTVFRWCKHDLASIAAGVCMLCLSPFLALLAILFVLLVVVIKLESFGWTLLERFAEPQS